MDKYLIVIDMQNDFIYGSLRNEEGIKIVQKVKEKIQKYKDEGFTIIFTRDTHFENYLETSEGKKLPVKHCIKNSDGWQIVDELDKIENVKYIDKPTFGYSKWKNELSPNSKIELIGVCTDICVVSNALNIKTLFPDAEMTVDASCCAGTTIEAHNAALSTMKSCQIDIVNE